MKPTRISFDWLSQAHAEDGADGDIFQKTLQDVGLVSITGIPNFHKAVLLETLERCIAQPPSIAHNDQGNGKVAAPLHTFEDGTRRRTLATRTLAGQVEPLMFKGSSSSSLEDVCREQLQAHSRPFRHAVQEVTKVLAVRLEEYLMEISPSGEGRVALLEDGSGEKFYSIEDVINKGEHLEHFHCYYNGDEKNGDGIDNDATNAIATIDWHTDQGLLLLFTPGLMRGQTTRGFFIQLKDGSAVEMDFDFEQDDLVLMLGDGVNQYVNPALRDMESDVSAAPWRAVPHALQMPPVNKISNNGDSDPASIANPPRVWYGRMILPPPQALHPSSTSASPLTFKEIRSSMIQKNPTALSLGCASHHQKARELQDDGVGDEELCNLDTSMWCWHRCMNHTDYDVSPAICKERSLSLGCANDDGYLWTDEFHDPAFGLDCVDMSTAGRSKLAATRAPSAKCYKYASGSLGTF
jgi:hypothetical protein